MNYLCATSWDKSAKWWEVAPDGNTQLKGQTQLPAPVLCQAWSADGSKVYLGCGDNNAYCWDLAQPTAQPVQVGMHAAPASCIAFSSQLQMVVTASWDKTVKFWTPGNPTCVATLPLQERAYCMDLRDERLVVATANRHVYVWNTQSIAQGNLQPDKQETSQLKYQTRCIAIFPDKDGYAIGSIEGKVGVTYFDQRQSKDNFSFRCHRGDSNGSHAGAPTEVFSVNTLTFNPRHKTFATTGSDGMFNFWDKTHRQRLKQFQKIGTPISDACFNYDGTIFAYAVSYDWSRGVQGYQQGAANAVFLHGVQDSEIKPRPRAGGRN